MADEAPGALLWHPHQKLWNNRLTTACRDRFGRGGLANALIAAIVAADTAMLSLRVGWRRFRRLVPGRASQAGRDGSSKPRVLYIDCGLHKRGEQVRQVYDWFGDQFDLITLGFEASEEHMRDATAALADLDGVVLHQVALVGPAFGEKVVKLYRSGDQGAGDSLFAERGEEFDVVPARRLTEIVADAGLAFESIPVIIRMNIEGAERFVIEDLIDAGKDGLVDGYYGMWDDLSKIDPAADRDFRQTLRKHGISTVTFNDRDMPPQFLQAGERPQSKAAALVGGIFRQRLSAIRRDIDTSIQAGLDRIGSRS